MKKIFTRFLLMSIVFCMISGCKPVKEGNVKTNGAEVVSFRVLPFSLTDVKLLDGPFLHATKLDEQTLLNYEPDRFLSKFYSEAGLKPKADHYIGWEDESLAGHSLGHYLSACSMMYQTTGDKRFLERVNYIVGELKKLQDSDGQGYIGAMPNGKKVFTEEIAKGNIEAQGGSLNGIWAPFYTQHKIMAGLRDAYRLCGDTTALVVEKKFADWIYRIVSQLNDDQIQKMLFCEHGGIAETLADLYSDTRDEKYINMSSTKFYQKAVLDSLKDGIDILPGKHCNTNIPKAIALARIYELTGDTSDRTAAEFFWKTVVNHHTYVTGGNGNNEFFGPADKLRNRLGEGTTESCNVYNMLKLTEHLFEWEATAKTADFYERALFNHILSSQNPQNGRVTYNLSLEMGGFKDYQDPLWFTCCVGTGMENHSKYGRNIFYHSDNDLFLFQFIASELIWKEKGLKIIQNTRYPEEQGTTLGFICEKPLKMTLWVRYPYWAQDGIEIRINGSKNRIRQDPGSFIAIDRTWKTGDNVEIKIPFSLRLESMPDDSNRVAVMYGPLVMAGDLGAINDSASNDPMFVPVLVAGNRNPEEWMKPVEGKANTFLTLNTGRPRDFELRPFYSFFDRRYSVYWDLFTEAGWKAKQVDYKVENERIKKIRESQIDFIQPGEMQPERDHNFKGEKSSAGKFRERINRESKGGWFSYDIKSNADTPVALVVEYWGGFPGPKTFDILANDKIIATENISNKKEGQFITVQYDIPENISRGRFKLNIKFMAHEGNTAGPVFSIRTIRR